jgi:hypothetical protein
VLSPPVTRETFDPKWLEGNDFIYFKLHGFRNDPMWYNENYNAALTASQIRSAGLSGAVVFVANCYLPESPMLQALLSAGAKAVVGGSGENYAKVDEVHGADLLGLYFRLMLEDYGAMLKMAKWRLVRKWPDKATLDALRFKIWTGEVLV